MRRVGAWLTMAAAVVMGGCWDDPGEVVETDRPGLVSDPIANVSAAAGAARAPAGAAPPTVAYVSLPPDSVPNGEVAVIRNVHTGDTVAIAMAQGGFDPVAIAASAGDRLAADIQRSGNSSPVHLEFDVPTSRRPRVVRVYPPHRKQDVVLNARAMIVFTEPIRQETINSASVRLLRGGVPVSGRAVVSADGLRAEFVPTQSLAPNTNYALLVTTGVTDLTGDRLAQAVGAEFTTGTTKAVASVATVEPALVRRYWDNELRTLEFNAILHDDGRVSGSFHIFYPVRGWTVTGAVTCFTIVDGKAAWVAGVVQDANPLTNIIGGEYGWRAADNGLPEGGVPDQVSLAFPLEPGNLGSAQEFCETTPTADAYEEIVLNDLLSGDIVVTGSTPPPRINEVASVRVTPDTVRAAAGPGYLFWVLADVKDASGSKLTGIPLIWTSSDTAVATIAYSGVDGLGQAGAVIAGKGVAGSVIITASARRRSGSATVVLENLDDVPLGSISVGAGPGSLVCFLTASGTPYCLGDNEDGQVGYGVAYTGAWMPVAVTGELRLAKISAGRTHSCALTVTGAAYCWGRNAGGQLGTVTTEPCGDEGHLASCRPVAVSGGLSFVEITTGAVHTCALTARGAAYCWGENDSGQLGDGLLVGRGSPVAVAGGLTFTRISAGSNQTCGLTPQGAAYCWGAVGTDSIALAPVPVAAGWTLADISLGPNHGCVLTTDGAVYCWWWYIGAGSGGATVVPLPVGVRLARIDAGLDHTCGLGADGSVYCWGMSHADENGVPFDPTPVQGLTFESVSGGSGGFDGQEGIACGVGTDRVGYCWHPEVGKPWRLTRQR